MIVFCSIPLATALLFTIAKKLLCSNTFCGIARSAQLGVLAVIHLELLFLSSSIVTGTRTVWKFTTLCLFLYRCRISKLSSYLVLYIQ
jgi:hypothetical protein